MAASPHSLADWALATVLAAVFMAAEMRKAALPGRSRLAYLATLVVAGPSVLFLGLMTVATFRVGLIPGLPRVRDTLALSRERLAVYRGWLFASLSLAIANLATVAALATLEWSVVMAERAQGSHTTAKALHDVERLTIVVAIVLTNTGRAAKTQLWNAAVLGAGLAINMLTPAMAIVFWSREHTWLMRETVVQRQRAEKKKE
jgi:hypothetical protein